MHSVYDFIISASHSECSVVTLQNQFDIIVAADKLNELFETAYLHGVFPLIYSKLKLLNIDNDILEIFKKENRYIAQINMRRTSELLEVIELFNKNNIDYMAIKGPVLSQLIHDDISQRQYSDLDILVKQESVSMVGKLLEEHNYKASHNVEFLQNKILLKVGKEFEFFHITSNNLLELHWKLFTNKDISEKRLKSFSYSYQNILISHKKVRTLNIEGLLIYLSLHGSKHYWERLAWVVDIDRLISQNSIKWERIKRIVFNMKNEKTFYLGLLVSVHLFQTKLPKDILLKAESFKDISLAVDNIVKLLYSNIIKIEEDNKVSQIEKIINIAQIKDTNLNSLRHYFFALLQLKELDVYVINLPYLLSPLYYVIRVFRMLFKLRKIK